jgi:hypothetical protein
MGILVVVGVISLLPCLLGLILALEESDNFTDFIWIICLFVVAVSLITTGAVLEHKIRDSVVISKTTYWTFDVPGLEKSSVPIFVEDTLFDYRGFSIFHSDKHEYKILKMGEVKE